MSRFTKGPNYRTPFGKNEFLGSTEGMKFESRTCADGSVPTETIDDATDQKVLQPGTILAKITSGGDSGKVGPFDLSATDGRQTKANIVGINTTFLPWQLMERDCEVAALTHGTVYPDYCHGYDALGDKVTLQDFIDATDLAASDFQTGYLDITFRVRSSELV